MEHFDFNDFEDFDSHIASSIPHFTELRSNIMKFIECMTGYGKHLDAGCSTGSLTIDLLKEGVDSYGIDLANIVQDHPNLIQGDIFKAHEYYEPESFEVISSIFFLQFLTPSDRAKALDVMAKLLKPRGYMIVTEKTFLDSPILNNICESLYLETKVNNFNSEQILTKKVQLAKTMYLKTKSELVEELSQYGKVETFWQYYGFVGCIVTL